MRRKRQISIEITDEMFDDLDFLARKIKKRKTTIVKSFINCMLHKADDEDKKLFKDILGDLDNNIPPAFIIFKPYKMVTPTIRSESTGQLMRAAVYHIEAPDDLDSPIYLEGNATGGWVIRRYSDNSQAWPELFHGDNHGLYKALKTAEKIIRNNIIDRGKK